MNVHIPSTTLSRVVNRCTCPVWQEEEEEEGGKEDGGEGKMPANKAAGNGRAETKPSEEVVPMDPKERA